MITTKRFCFGDGADKNAGSHVAVDIIQIMDEQYGLYVWPSSLVLAQYIWHHRGQFAGSHVLELGAGTALPGILAAKLGATVTLTDSTDKRDVLANMHRTCELNDAVCDVYGLNWGLCDDERYSSLISHRPPDIILGADVLYDSAEFELLFATVRWLLDAHRVMHGREKAAARFVTAYHQRSAHRSLEFLLRKWGLQVVHVEHPGEYMPLDQGEALAGASIHVVEIQLAPSH